VVAGYFNMIITIMEKNGGLQREDADMVRFRETQITLQLIDINTLNGKYTWNNR